ncbi:MAG: hypothetical protein FWE49_02580 [Synergistaceae bacterium]|nr:hypothetical protein [Synergistaceae bacterium]
MEKSSRAKTIVGCSFAVIMALSVLLATVHDSMEGYIEDQKRVEEALIPIKRAIRTKLNDIGVYVNEYACDNEGRIEEIGDGDFIYVDKLELQLHLYSTFIATYYDNGYRAPTKNGIKKMYNAIRPTLLKRFNHFCSWAEISREYIRNYEDALRTAKIAYDEEYGLYKGKLHYGDLTANERIELAQFVRNNPDFMPEDIYSEVLKNLELITLDAYESIKQECNN